MPPPVPASPQRDISYDSSMSAFYKASILPLVLELGLIAWAARGAAIPVGGDPTLRYVSMGVPGFWAIILPIIFVFGFITFNGQMVSITPKAFVYRRGRFSILIPWQDLTYQPSHGGRFDRQFSVTGKSSVIVIRSLFFPRYDEIEREVEARLKQRDRPEHRL